MEVLNISSLTKFTITDKFESTKVLPGTEGYISFVTAQNSYISSAHVIITKKGKKGKPRIEKYDIYIPIVYDSTVPVRDFFSGCSHMDFEDTRGNVLDMDDLDFLGWASAYRYLLGYLAKQSTINYGIWSKSDNCPIRNLYRHFGDGTNQKLELVRSKDFRLEFIKEISAVSSIMNENLSDYHINNSTTMIQNAFASIRSNYRNQLPGKAEQHENMKEFEKSWVDKFIKK